MKKIVVACGAGLATSGMVINKVQEVLKQNKIKAEVVQSRLAELKGHDDGNANVFLTTMKVNESQYKTPVIQASAYLTGIGEEEVSKKLINLLKE